MCALHGRQVPQLRVRAAQERVLVAIFATQQLYVTLRLSFVQMEQWRLTKLIAAGRGPGCSATAAA